MRKDDLVKTIIKLLIIGFITFFICSRLEIFVVNILNHNQEKKYEYVEDELIKESEKERLNIDTYDESKWQDGNNPYWNN